eukprot:2355267-Amphidinium_carterae.1
MAGGVREVHRQCTNWAKEQFLDSHGARRVSGKQHTSEEQSGHVKCSAIPAALLPFSPLSKHQAAPPVAIKEVLHPWLSGTRDAVAFQDRDLRQHHQGWRFRLP